MPGQRPQPARPRQAPTRERPRRRPQPPWQLVSLAIALGMGVGTIGALVVEGPFVTRYVVVDLRPLEPAPSTAPELLPGLPLQPNIPPRRDPAAPGAQTGPGPASELLEGSERTTGAVPPPGTRARVSTGRGAASVREAWLRARRRKDGDGAPGAPAARSRARPAANHAGSPDRTPNRASKR
jgi:hypothetical protein